MCGQFSKLWKSYRGSTPEDRPEAANDAWNNPESLPTLEAFDSAFRQWLAAFYHAQASTGKILKGKSPAEVRAAAAALRSPVSEEDLRRAFLRTLPHNPRTIHAGGVVRACGRNYQSDTLWNLMAKTRMVVVKVDPDDVSRLYAFTEDGRDLGVVHEVQSVAGIASTPVEIEQLREQTRQKNAQMRELKRLRKAALGSALRGNIADAVFALPAPAPQAPAAPAVPAATATPDPDDIAAMAELAELDEIVRKETAKNKTAMDAGLDEFDRADLAEINHHEERP